MARNSAIESNGFLLTVERIVTLYPSLTTEEKMALADWEKTYVTGDGTATTTQWPGWPAVIKRLGH